MYRRYPRKRHEYLKTVFHDEEIYHASFAEEKVSETWKPVTVWGTGNAWNWKLDVMPYPLLGRFKELCSIYRWVKINYISFYFAVSCYTYTAMTDMDIVLEETPQSTKKKFTGAIRDTTSNIGPIIGADKMHLVWNLDNLVKEESATLNYFEASSHKKSAVINKNKYIKFFFVYPKMIGDS